MTFKAPWIDSIYQIHGVRFAEPLPVSISLNLIGRAPGISELPQYEFDIEEQKVSGLLAGNIVQKLLLPFDLISVLGMDENLIELISYIAKNHYSAHVRSAAYGSLAKVDFTGLEKVITNGLHDPSDLVKHTVKDIVRLEC